MAREQQVPSLVIRLICESVIDNLGPKSLHLLFTQTGLQRYYDGGELPPDDESPSATIDELSTIFTMSFQIFGDKGMKPILLRAGRDMLHHFRAHNKALAALAGTAFTVLPTDTKIKLVLSRAAKIGEELLHSPHRTYDTPEGYFVEITNSPYCVGITSDHGVCYFPVGFYSEALRWATGQTYAVTETACVAAGAQVCRFHITHQEQP
ncbi:MAG: hypothetical protein GFH27_549293n304 [Chloroflexi bacterium AL-W]|nr:hypothetical protein [Chloroflexi bacterium AL-N1]NOK67581.1 hypothetical protein [Chloroflexi bacterium AL-N10]NOK75649.1 hypothetical protein [Chloroflexi bacterium AL-N5]NOK82437.1 hypothetical protein [Chloroflexi bacterium AL-W]NOK90282.1 hypothetical protein [Chloroflexi bacterium AL-N15]